MENNITYTTLFNKFKESIKDGTFAKLTFAKTIGKPELQNIYVRTVIVDNVLKLNVTFKIYKDGLQETEQIIEIDDVESELTSYINNPFMSVLLFTTEADVTMKLNKKRVATIIEQAPTFKNADVTLIEFRGKN